MTNIETRLFLKKMLLFCLVLTGASLLLFDTFLKAYYISIFPVQFGLIAVVTTISHLRLLKSSTLKASGFNQAYLSTMALKLLIYLTFVVVCLLIDKTEAIIFVINFLLLYLLFTIFEVNQILNFLKK